MWFEEHSGYIIEGNQYLNREFSLHEIPIYARAG